MWSLPGDPGPAGLEGAIPRHDPHLTEGVAGWRHQLHGIRSHEEDPGNIGSELSDTPGAAMDRSPPGSGPRAVFVSTSRLGAWVRRCLGPPPQDAAWDKFGLLVVCPGSRVKW